MAKKAMPQKAQPKMHQMPGGHMMKDSEMKKMMGGKMPPKGMPPKDMKAGNWIAGAIKHPGALRKALGAKPGKPIPAAKLAKAAKGKGVTAKRARLAKTLRQLHK